MIVFLPVAMVAPSLPQTVVASRPAQSAATDAMRKAADTALRRGIVHLVTTPAGEPFEFASGSGGTEIRFHTRAEDARSATNEAHGVRATDLREVERLRAAGKTVRVVGAQADIAEAKTYSPSGEYTSTEAPGFLVRANEGYTTIATTEGTFVPIFFRFADAKELREALGKHPDGRPMANIVCAPVDKLSAMVATGEEGVRLLRFLGYDAVPPAVSSAKQKPTSPKTPKPAGKAPGKPSGRK